MPTNHTTHSTVLSARVSRLAVEAQLTIDELLVQPFDDIDAEMYLTPAAMLLAMALEDLLDAIYRAEKFDQSQRRTDLAIARAIAGAQEDRAEM